MKSYRRKDQNGMHAFTIKYTLASPQHIGHYYRYDEDALSIDSILDKLAAKAKEYGQAIATIEGIWKDGNRLGSSTVKAYDEKYGMADDSFNECDSGAVGGAGGDVGGATAIGDGATTADAGDIAGEMAGTSVTDVLGKYEPGKGVMGVGNFMIPARVKHPLHRWEIANGGSKRKKGKNGKPKKYEYEKGMKVVVDMFEDDTDDAKASKQKLMQKLKQIAKGIKDMNDVEVVEQKFEKDKGKVLSKLSNPKTRSIRQVCIEFGDFLKDVCTGNYKASWFTITMVAVGLVYLLSPIDLVPDAIPVVGFIDDAFVLKLVYDAIKDEIAEWKKAKRREQNMVAIAEAEGEWIYHEDMPEAENDISSYDYEDSMHDDELKAELVTSINDLEDAKFSDADDYDEYRGFKKTFSTKQEAIDFAINRLHDEMLAYEDDTRYYASNEEWESEKEQKTAEYEKALKDLKSKGYCSLTDGRYVTWQCSVYEA